MKIYIESNLMNSVKRTYSTPTVTCIQLDNEISLQLTSMAPTIDIGDPNDPDCPIIQAPEYFNKDPYRNNA